MVMRLWLGWEGETTAKICHGFMLFQPRPRSRLRSRLRLRPRLGGGNYRDFFAVFFVSQPRLRSRLRLRPRLGGENYRDFFAVVFIFRLIPPSTPT